MNRILHRLVPRPLLSLTIGLLWLALAETVSPGTVLLGVTLALSLPRLTRAFWPDAPRLRRPGRALRFLGAVAFDMLNANWRVARRVLGPLDRLRPALVEVPLELRDPFVAALLGSVVCLTPGTVTVDIDRQRWVLLVHALDAPDPRALIRDIKTRYEQPLREIFAC